MASKTAVSEAYAEIDAAQKAVVEATASYSKGGSVEDLNRANRRLAEAHDRAYTVAAGTIPDDR